MPVSREWEYCYNRIDPEYQDRADKARDTALMKMASPSEFSLNDALDYTNENQEIYKGVREGQKECIDAVPAFEKFCIRTGAYGTDCGETTWGTYWTYGRPRRVAESSIWPAELLSEIIFKGM